MKRDDDAFDDRKKSQEAKYKMDEERRFKVRSRRNKLLGLWAGERLGLDGDALTAFAGEIVMMGLEVRTEADFQAAFIQRLAEGGLAADAGAVVALLSELDAEAAAQIAREFPKALDSDHCPVGDGPLTPNK